MPSYQRPPPQGQSTGYQRGNTAQNRGKAPQVHALGADSMEIDHTPTALDGIIPIFGTYAHVLFDTGATHSFIAQHYAHSLGLKL